MKSNATCICRALLIALALVLTARSASAQQKTGQLPSPTDSERQAGNNFHSSFASAEFAFDGSAVIQGAPFSAVGTKETTQILSDGSRVVRRMTTSIYRDSLGRTRFNWGNGTKDPSAGAPMIYDPVAGAIYFVDTKHRRVLQLSSAVKGASLRQPKIINPQSPPENLTQVVGETIEPLGTGVIEGVKAEGVRVTTTVPAAENRDHQPGKVIFERWYSQELRRTVLIKLTDPRFGEAVFKLTNIDRSEPPSELFLIPAGYQLDLMTPGPRPRTLKSGYAK